MVAITPIVSATGGRSVDVTVQSDSSGREASPGEPAEYTITVRNTGDEDVTINLAANQEAGGCQGYTSAIEQIPGTLEAGQFEQVTLTVNVSDDSSDQVADDCDTTVTATATTAEPLSTSAPMQTDVTVTTTKGEGSGNALYGVELSAVIETKNYNGEETVEFIVNVKNTGQSQASISLEMTDSSSCRSDGLNPDIDPTQMTLNSEEDDEATVSIPVPDGEQTEAGSHCFIVRATVTNDPNQQSQAQDNISLTLNIPELHKCEASISPTSMTLAPGGAQSGVLTLQNTGNSDWTVTFGKSGTKSNWVSAAGPSTSLLEYDNGNGETSFSFNVEPDDSLAADSVTQIEILGKDGNSPVDDCSATLTITVGQSYAVAAALSNDNLHHVDPGTSDVTKLTITNQGNGQDSFSIGHSAVPSGWSVTLSDQDGNPISSVSLQGKHASQSERQIDVDITVFVPTDALADETLVITLSVSSSGSSSATASDDLDVSVAERHALLGNVLSVDQTGRSGEDIKFPVSITNDGNVQDSFRLRACDPSQPSSCVSPSWSTRFVDASGQTITQISLNAGESQEVYLEIEISSEDEGDYIQVEARVNIVAEPSNEYSRVVTARVSNYDYLMHLTLENPQGAPDSTGVKLPPGGEVTINMLLTDVGTSHYRENALFTVYGMDSTISRELSVEGLSIEIGSTPFEILDKSHTYAVQVKFSVLSGVANGEAGVVDVCAASMRNTVEPSCVAVVITVETVHDLSVSIVDGPIQNITHKSGASNSADFMVEIRNDGNVDEEIEISSTEGLRGWTVDIEKTEHTIEAGETITVRVRVKPPVEMASSDEFEFTLLVTPTEAPVAAQPIDMTVKAELDDSVFGFSSQTWNIITWSTLGVIGLAILILLFSNMRRSERFQQSAIVEENED